MLTAISTFWMSTLLLLVKRPTNGMPAIIALFEWVSSELSQNGGKLTPHLQCVYPILFRGRPLSDE